MARHWPDGPRAFVPCPSVPDIFPLNWISSLSPLIPPTPPIFLSSGRINYVTFLRKCLFSLCNSQNRTTERGERDRVGTRGRGAIFIISILLNVCVYLETKGNIISFHVSWLFRRGVSAERDLVIAADTSALFCLLLLEWNNRNIIVETNAFRGGS